ncbi:MAG: hypothetical protein DWQ34_18540 [Planctomycetota bacterium]|nr:MAG: hypothetical protein DWQ34_18540 [Planctomycetota bacterium]
MIGFHVTEWWNTEAAPIAAPVAPPLSPWDDPGGVRLDFAGADWSLQRRPVEGTEEAATSALVQLCGDVVETSRSGERLPPMDQAEQELLRRLAEWTPIAELESGRVYAVGGPLPWIVGTLQSGASGETAAGAADGGRVVCWGLALPQPDGRWMLYVLDRRGTAAGETERWAEDFPLPDGVRTSMTVSSKEGGALVCLSGGRAVSTAMREFERTLSAAGWRCVREWTGDGPTFSSSFESVDDDGRVLLDLTVTSDGWGGWNGVADFRTASVIERE